MSCIEGDSLLKEIEKSLEQHNKMEQMGFQEEEDEGDDFEMMLQQHNPRQQQYQEDRLKVNEFLNISNKDAEKEGRKLKSLNVDSDIDEDNPEEFQMESRNPIASGSSNTAFVKSTLKKLSYSNEGSHHQTSPGKLRVVQANKPAAQRHTALITQQQQFGNKRTSQSQLMQRRKNGLQEPQRGKVQGKAKQAVTQQRGRSSEEEGLPLSINGTPRAQSDERKAQITSITVGPAFGSGDAHSRKSKSKEKIQAKNLNRILTNTAAQQSSSKQNRRHSNTSKKQRYGTQPHQQSVGARLGGAPRSKSRLSNQSNQQHFKSMKDQGQQSSQPRQGRKSLDQKRPNPKSKSSQEARSSTSAKKNLPKKRDHSAESQVRSNQDSITPGAQAPLLTQPSFTEHTAFPHNYSFDASRLRNHNSSSKTSIKQQVLFNQQKIMMHLQQSNNMGGSVGTVGKRKSQTRPQTAMGKVESVQSVVSMDNTKKGIRGKSNENNKKQSSIASLTTTGGGAQSLGKQMEQSRQQQMVQGIMQMVATRNHQPHASLQSFTKTHQKENSNLLARATNLMHQLPRKSQAKTLKDFASGILAQQKSQSRDQHANNHHTSATTYMANQITRGAMNRSFFDQNSPLLQKKSHVKRKSGGSHSPQQKKVNKISQKATSEIKSLVSGVTNSRQATAQIFPSGLIYATGGRNKSIGAMKSTQGKRKIHQSFMQQPDQFVSDDQNYQSWHNLPESIQSFDKAFLTKGSQAIGDQRQKQATPLVDAIVSQQRAQLPIQVQMLRGKSKGQVQKIGQYLRAT
ncbi:hypothetical protein FGO68_gene16880 [Halteria grandinella]|uniref:Uncharacterized protein n=1 Tax=Halteria grandinella TaxID=5974 RepID=A0A8J8NFP1_HALGN|nr:hypothetical protein FGO68_gene16880 [Halteria grandinella]